MASSSCKPLHGRLLASMLSSLLALSLLSPAVQAEGGFVGLQVGITDSQDMDSFGNTFKLTFGPNITDRLALELGVMDIGEASYNDPKADFTGVDDDTPPTFINAKHGTVVRTNAITDEQNPANNRQAVATYTGFANARPQSFLITFRYRFPLTDDIDFFLKTGANLWFADYDMVEVKAFQDQTISRRVVDSKQTSAIDQISGGGFLWHALPDLALRAELETTALDSKEFSRVRFQLVTLGVQYEF